MRAREVKAASDDFLAPPERPALRLAVQPAAPLSIGSLVASPLRLLFFQVYIFYQI